MLAGGEDLVALAVGGCGVPALETRQVEHNHIGIEGSEHRGPHRMHTNGLGVIGGLVC